MERLEKILFILFSILFFLTPLIFWPFTSEVFEFNKIIVTYIVTLLIVSVWLVRMIYEGKFIFRRTLIDIPLILFLSTQLLSTIFSVDPRTSFLGYYSRFNGGLISSVCYALLYWAFVSNITTDKVKKLIFVFLASSVVVSSIGALEHFGTNLTCSPVQIYNLSTNEDYKNKFNLLTTKKKISTLLNTNCWVQDVKHRVFSTLGQPNWLGTFLAALIPLTWALSQKYKIGSKKYLALIAISALFFSVLLFTKSRSSLLGFLFAAFMFWGISFWKYKRTIVKPFLFQSILIVVLAAVVGTQFTPNIKSLMDNSQKIEVQTKGPALEVGGTESGEIRKIVWKGALNLWGAYPLIGSGVETFAYTYYQTRPLEHNLVSEWDFVYNKAHNEYLNFAANSGTLGILSYLTLIGATILMFIKIFKDSKSQNGGDKLIVISLLAGYCSVLVSNFFGFSVVITQIELFLFPAIAFISVYGDKSSIKSKKDLTFNSSNILPTAIVFIMSILILFSIIKYWKADVLYAKSERFWRDKNYSKSLEYINKAIEISPKESLYHLQKSIIYTDSAIFLYEEGKVEELETFIKQAIDEANAAERLSPRNVNIKRSIFTMYIKLSVIDPNYLVSAGKTLQDAIVYAPTNAKFFYNLALVYARVGKPDEALKTIEKTIQLKSNYKEARLAYALILIDKGETQKAKTELEYILKNIDPDDLTTKQTLEELK